MRGLGLRIDYDATITSTSSIPRHHALTAMDGFLLSSGKLYGARMGCMVALLVFVDIESLAGRTSVRIPSTLCLQSLPPISH